MFKDLETAQLSVKEKALLKQMLREGEPDSVMGIPSSRAVGLDECIALWNAVEKAEMNADLERVGYAPTVAEENKDDGK